MTFGVEEESVSSKELNEEGCRASLVPVSQRVILHDEVEQVCSFLLSGRVEILTIKTLINGSDCAVQFVLRVSTEQVVLGELSSDASYDLPGLWQGQLPSGYGTGRVRDVPLVVLTQ